MVKDIEGQGNQTSCTVSCLWRGSGPVVQHYCNGTTCTTNLSLVISSYFNILMEKKPLTVANFHSGESTVRVELFMLSPYIMLKRQSSMYIYPCHSKYIKQNILLSDEQQLMKFPTTVLYSPPPKKKEKKDFHCKKHFILLQFLS